uniref:Uncharacterized protein n=1 Tax=Aegilops tauschii subsp. strangulata TaxID=200361 RepID=A0A453SKF6_AEGTS
SRPLCSALQSIITLRTVCTSMSCPNGAIKNSTSINYDTLQSTTLHHAWSTSIN